MWRFVSLSSTAISLYSISKNLWNSSFSVASFEPGHLYHPLQPPTLPRLLGVGRPSSIQPVSYFDLKINRLSAANATDLTRATARVQRFPACPRDTRTGHGPSWVYSYSHNHTSTRVPDITATTFLFRLPPASRPTAKLHTFQASKERKLQPQRQAQRTVLRRWHPPWVEITKQPRSTAASMPAPRSGPVTTLPRPQTPTPREAALSPSRRI